MELGVFCMTKNWQDYYYFLKIHILSHAQKETTGSELFGFLASQKNGMVFI